MLARIAAVFKSVIGKEGEALPALDTPIVTPEARVLTDRLDRARRLGLRSHAERLARSALPLVGQHSGLAERVARLRLSAGDTEGALDIIDTCHRTTASLRMLRLVCLVTAGRKLEAHTELLRWSSNSSAPLDARRLLALLEWEDGAFGAASEALIRNIRMTEDPVSIASLILTSLAEDRHAQAQSWADQLRELGSIESETVPARVLLASLGLGLETPALTPSNSQTRRLATELLAHEAVVPALVEAQRRSPDPASARLLAAALEISLLEFDDPHLVMECLARLCLVLDQTATAARWIEQAMAGRPYVASLALLRTEVEAQRVRARRVATQTEKAA